MKKHIDTQPRNNKRKRHGYWEKYYTGGVLAYKCYFINDEESGYEELYSISNELLITFHL